MALVLFTIGDVVVNALTFSVTNFAFSRLTDHGREERKRHDFALEKLQRAKDKWNRDRMKRLDQTSLTKDRVKEMRQGLISKMLMS